MTPHLPASLRILPHSNPLVVPDFRLDNELGLETLAPSGVSSEDWFEGFVAQIEASMSERRYLPICRLSDGEYRFMFGPQGPSPRLSTLARIKHAIGELRRFVSHRGRFVAATRPSVSSGNYSKTEVSATRGEYLKMLRCIGDKGVLAMHLSYGSVPFQEAYFPSIADWLRESGVALTTVNYVPFYFVYALLTGPRRRRILLDRRVLVVHSADGPKRRAIEESLLEEVGVGSVDWMRISPSRSLFDRIEPGPHIGDVDIALVGAGVGKPNILLQLEPLAVPAIDAGYVFEIWADSQLAGSRPFTEPSSDDNVTS